MKNLSLICLTAAFSTALVAGPLLDQAARGDTETCVSRVEYDNTQAGETVDHVAFRFDVYGYYLGDNGDGTYRRGYRTCWAPGVRRVVVVYSYNSGESVDWFVHDV